MNDYCATALDYLGLAFDRQQALFSYSSTVDDRGQLVNDFRQPESFRYTINTYLGLFEAQLHGGEIGWLGRVEDRVWEFLARHELALNSSADHGLLLVLLAATDPSHPAVGRSLSKLERLLSRDGDVRGLNMQDLAWMLWGTSRMAHDPRAATLADRLFELIRTRYIHPVTGLPRHSGQRYRAHTVSFGSIVYFLRSMHEYAEAFDSRAARELFTAAVQRVLAIQGDHGDWPWMVDVRSGVPFDRYPIFTVHQDSMAMLFLFPAEAYGVAGAAEAIQPSLLWNSGLNELAVDMVLSQPYPWVYRSIERDESVPRARRYLRGLGRPSRRYPPRSQGLRINRECRSYHLGWVLYAWSNPDRARQLETVSAGT